MAFELPPLPFAANALEPHIDAATMEIHHDRHHNAYVTKANDALKGTSLESETCPWTVCAKLAELPADKQTAVRNNAGGHANHSLFWQILAPAGQGGECSPELAGAIDADLGGMEKFKESFAAAAAGRFGSGWAWLCFDKGAGKLHVCSTANQDNTVMSPEFGGEPGEHAPLLGLDVWEHAYYLKYQNKRPDYISAFWNVVNWAKVSEWFAQAKG